MHSPVDYDDVAQALLAGASAVHPSEAHGCLCGALCLRPDYSRVDWLEEILPEASRESTDGDPLEMLFTLSAGALARPDMEFEPMLPGDEVPLERRVEALAAWCQGFLYGFGAAGTANRSGLPESVSEFLADLARISQAGDVGSGTEEVEEAAYAELVEFLRVGVQLVYDELAALRAGQPAVLTNH